MQIRKNTCDASERRFLCDNSSKSILDTLKPSQIWNGCASQEGVAEIKSEANNCCSYGFRSLNGKRNTNVTQRTNMEKANLAFSETCSSKDIFESLYSVYTQILNWGLKLDRRASNRDRSNRSAKAARGFDLGLLKTVASDLVGFEYRPLFKSQSWTLWEQDSIEAIWEVSVKESIPVKSWMSSAYWWEDTVLFWFDWSEFLTFATGDMKRTKSSGLRTEPLGTPVSLVTNQFSKGWAAVEFWEFHKKEGQIFPLSPLPSPSLPSLPLPSLPLPSNSWAVWTMQTM